MISISFIYDLLHGPVLLWRRMDENAVGINAGVLCLIIKEISGDVATED